MTYTEALARADSLMIGITQLKVEVPLARSPELDKLNYAFVLANNARIAIMEAETAAP